MNNLNTSEKIAELRKWVLNVEEFYGTAQGLSEVSKMGLKVNYVKFMFAIAEKAQIFIKPSEIDTISEAIKKLVKGIE